MRLAVAALAALACLGAAPAAHATALVVVHGGTEIVVAADAREVHDGVARDTRCKVHVTPAGIFATQGPLRGPGFDAEHAARDALASARDVDAALDGWLATVRAPFAAMATATPDEHWSGARRIEVVMIGRRGGRAVALHGGWRMVDGQLAALPRTEFERGDIRRHHVAMQAFLSTAGPSWFRPPYARIARALVEHEIALQPQSGGPVSMLSVDVATGRATWLELGACS